MGLQKRKGSFSNQPFFRDKLAVKLQGSSSDGWDISDSFQIWLLFGVFVLKTCQGSIIILVPEYDDDGFIHIPKINALFPSSILILRR